MAETGFIGGAGIADRWRYRAAAVPRVARHRFPRAGRCGRRSDLHVFRELAGMLRGDPFRIETISDRFRRRGRPGLRRDQHAPRRRHPGAHPVPGTDPVRAPEPAHHHPLLPSRSQRAEVAGGAARRGVRVEILTAGPHIDHPVVRRLSRESSRRMLEAGAAIHEYQPSMIHAKLMTVDRPVVRCWIDQLRPSLVWPQ